MFTKKSDPCEAAKNSIDYESLRERNKVLGEKNEKLTLVLQRLLKYHGVWENYVHESRFPPYIPLLDLDQLHADLEAVYAVTKADEARARLTATEKEPKEQPEQTRERSKRERVS